MRFERMAAGLMLALALGAAGCGVTRVTTGSLLAEMTDLDGLAEYPEPAFTCRQFSSYDRKSQTPEDAEGWFANRDFAQFLRTEERGGRTEYVLMEADGPGAIVRIWSANPKGTLRIYLDHAEKPVLEAPMADLLGGKVPGFPEPLATVTSRGWNLYFPIPYARHCLVTSDERAFYYHVGYRTYVPGTPVETFKAEELEKLEDRIRETARRLEAGGAEAVGGTGDGGKTTMPAGRRLELWGAEDGPGAVRRLWVKVKAADVPRALRGLVLRMEFDGEQTVACPLGDFFGTVPGVNAYDSLPVQVSADGGMACRWVMPYRRSARITVENTGPEEVELAWRVDHGPRPWTHRSMHFAAQWRVARDVPTRPFIDWNYVQVEGRGVFVGAAFSIANPVRHWWGEGDEKIYVDGEAFPSFFGTGTEDYYGYAWCCNVPFSHAYHDQPRCDGPGNYGWTCVNRWHVLDRIPFQRKLRFDMELWHWWEGRVPEMSVVTYWYARPGATSNREPLEPGALRLADLPPYVPPKVEGALEGEALRVVHRTGEVGPQDIGGCSNDKHLWWRPGRDGGRLVLAFPAPKAGRYRVFMRCVRAGDYGMVQVRINGGPPSEPLDFYNNGIALSKELLLGEYTLREGENYLAVEGVGAHPKAIKAYMFGLDYLRLEPVE